MEVAVDRFVGCVLGLATGDALGAPYEGGPAERLLWRLIGRTSDGCLRWTDDTQMALDLAESLLAEGEVCPGDLARRFASSYRWSRGYGPGATRVLRRIRRGEPWEAAAKAVYAAGSYGNGAAMRAPVLALFFPHDRDQVIAAARLSARVTHTHPLGIEGAVMIAVAAQALLQDASVKDTVAYVRAACELPEMSRRLETISDWLGTEQQPRPRDVARRLGNGTAAPASCPTALYVALRHIRKPFEEMMQFLIACRGDVDTLASMAGALWGIANEDNRLPSVRLESRDHLMRIATQLFRMRAHTVVK